MKDLEILKSCYCYISHVTNYDKRDIIHVTNRLIIISQLVQNSNLVTRLMYTGAALNLLRQSDEVVGKKQYRTEKYYRSSVRDARK